LHVDLGETRLSVRQPCTGRRRAGATTVETFTDEFDGRERPMPGKHISSQFDADLNRVSTHMLDMGALVAAQLTDAMLALHCFDPRLIDKILANERRLNGMEIELDAECGKIIARRQPTACDLRLLMASSKAITNLERAGDEVRKIAKRTRRIMAAGAGKAIDIAEIEVSSRIAVTMIRHALDAFARLDTIAAAQIVRGDQAIDDQFRAFMRKLATHMSEAPHSISVALDYLFIAKAIERIGDHATNLAELVIYVVKGEDVRHVSLAELEHEALGE
jgi:phosphate transport system protein